MHWLKHHNNWTKKYILTKNEDIVLSFTQGLAFGIPCSAKENVMRIDFVWFVWVLAAEQMLQACIVLPHHPTTKTTKWSNPVCK